MKNLGIEINSIVREIQKISETIFVEELQAEGSRLSPRGLSVLPEHLNAKAVRFYEALRQADRVGLRLQAWGREIQSPCMVKLNIWNASSFACDDLLRN